MGQTIRVDLRFRLGFDIADESTPLKLVLIVVGPFFAEGCSRANGFTIGIGVSPSDCILGLAMDLDDGTLLVSVDEWDAGEQEDRKGEYELPLMDPRPPFAWRPSEHGSRWAVESH